ncbi:geranylgeranyl diphosphate synthase type II [Virgibacillus natechei]|uniref:Geranylgeranyl diphosphate synthase type II n=1 Tax=Virgibacillus natechei TaxID=1216297 RepID=A0ABS4IFM0_9BACI|nr:farnesyl diphosphate synthase [Virgibacillus natechei]MBP1969705.1 geranylgeranyl diphosphate synthase type II [Virgibacillus natechei]UZD11430.1 polyprenyl synthetase family protein [Virgibacillus natechei]
MAEKLTEYINHNKKIIQDALKNYLYHLDIPKPIKESMLYSVEGGGKRLRPILLLASYEAYSENVNKALSSAVALELIHTYSLIHDDLPALDNDDFRRGEPTNHKVFDEATSILAGDALLTYSFEIISNDPLLADNQKVELMKKLSYSSGPAGMVGGQILDIKAENKPITLTELENVHALKTGELLMFATYAGAYLGNASKDQLTHLQKFAYYLGLIFQVQDDILDVTGDPDKVGRPIGSDEGNEKSTFPKLLGLEGAKTQKQEYVDIAKRELIKADAQNTFLMTLTDYFSQRDH